MNKNFLLRFGALAPDIKKQLASQGLYLPPVSADRFQVLANAVTQLYIAGIISESAKVAAHKKLMKRIELAMKK